MRLARSSLLPALALCGLLAACAVPTAGSEAPVKAQTDCVAAAARRYQVATGDIRIDSSQMAPSSAQFEVDLTNTRTGRRAKCTVDQNGEVMGVIDRR